MKVLLIGSEGRMGQSMKLFLKQQGCVFYGIDKNNREIDNFNFDVIVDFSSAEALEENLTLALSHKVPIVIATTNHTKHNYELIKKYKQGIPIFMSSNFSILFNVMLKMINSLKVVKDFQFVVTEKHHKTKKDKPSGSAKQIIKNLNLIKVKPKVYCHRVGDVVGEHSIFVYGENEYLSLSHTAISRQVFCGGAYMACEYILNKPNGLYNMENLLDDCL